MMEVIRGRSNRIKKKKNYDFNRSVKYRSGLICSVFVFFFILFAIKALKLQVTQKDKKLKTLYERQSNSRIKLTPQRAGIYDTNLKELALSIKMDSLYIHPREVKNKKQVANFLSSILEIPKERILKKLKSKRRFVWLKRLLEPEVAKKISAKKIPGLNLIKESKRFYPNKHLAAQMLGFAGYDSKGLEGLELKFNKNLMGRKQHFKVRTDAHRRPILALVNNEDNNSSKEMLFTNFISKENIVLTIDKDIQYWAEQELEKAVIESEAPRGEAIIMDPNSGKILAMANYPFFNPNNFAKYPPYIYKNRVITDMFDPGSTFKLITTAISFDLGLSNPNTVYFCENGSYTVGRKKKIREATYKKFADLTTKEIIKYSSNIGTVKIAEKIDTKTFYDYILKFGFNAKTGIDLPGESPGRIRHYKSWNEVDKANASFGQGISTTSIQVVSAISALVNGGTLYRPYVVDRIVDNNRKTIKRNEPHIIRENLIKPKTTKMIKEVMKAVVTPDGTGSNTIIPGMSIGGKTGTAQKFDFTNYRYYSNRYISSFIGAFPLEKPQYIVFIKIDDPLKNKYASACAVPAFKQVANYLIGKIKRNKMAESAPTVKDVPSKDLITHYQPEKILKLKRKIIMKQELYEIPDLKNKSLRDALRVFNSYSFDYEISGSGKVKSQEPAPGTFVSRNTKIKLKLE